MANEKVILRRGLSSTMPSTRVPGTIYIQTDTKQVYLDDTNRDRIHIEDDTKLPLEGTAKSAESADKLKTPYTIDGIQFDGSSAIRRYGACTTSGSEQEKTVSITNFSLIRGARITVRFSGTNTASNPTLNVSSTGAKPITYRRNPIAPGYLVSGGVYDFVYNSADDGSYELVGEINDNSNVIIDDGSID